jgi:5-methylcytosine-specific restriction endonuclease McrA
MSKHKNKNELKRKSKHHIIPKSRGGKRNLENIVTLIVRDHRAYHALFENKTPPEIIDYLVNKYWNGNAKYVDEFYRDFIYKYDREPSEYD